MCRLLKILLCISVCITTQIWRTVDATPFDYLPLAQSARVEVGPAISVTYAFASIKPRQQAAAGKAWRNKVIVRPSIGWQFGERGIGMEVGGKVAASLFYSRVDLSPYVKVGVSQQRPLALALLTGFGIKKDAVAPRITTVASYTFGSFTVYIAGDLTIRSDTRSWGTEFGIEKDVSRHFRIAMVGRVVISQYWRSYVMGIGGSFHF